MANPLFAVMVRLQAKVGSEGIRWGRDAARAVRSYMEAGYSFIQQVRSHPSNGALYFSLSLPLS